MPDILMCQNEECKDKETCYRYTATPSGHMQSYSIIEGEKTKEDCGEYWDNQK